MCPQAETLAFKCKRFGMSGFILKEKHTKGQNHESACIQKQDSIKRRAEIIDKKQRDQYKPDRPEKTYSAILLFGHKRQGDTLDIRQYETHTNTQEDIRHKKKPKKLEKEVE